MIFGLFNLIPGFAWALLLAISLATATVQTVRLTHLQASHAEYKQRIVEATLAAEVQARTKERQLQAEVERIAANAQERQNQQARRAADVDRALDGLRKHIARANSAPAPSDSVAAAQSHAASAARELLGTCAAEYRAVAESADRLGSQVTGLQDYARAVSKK